MNNLCGENNTTKEGGRLWIITVGGGALRNVGESSLAGIITTSEHVYFSKR